MPGKRVLGQELAELSAQGLALKAELDRVREAITGARDDNVHELSDLRQHLEQVIQASAGKLAVLEQRFARLDKENGLKLSRLQQRVDEAGRESARQVADLKQHVDQTHLQGSSRLVDLEQRLDQASETHREELAGLQRQLAQVDEDSERKLTVLQQRVEQAGTEYAGRLAELESDVDHARDETRRDLTDLSLRLDRAESERNEVRHQLAGLQGALQDLSARQDTTETRVGKLGMEFRREQSRALGLVHQVRDREHALERRSGRMMWATGAAVLVIAISGATTMLGVRNHDRALDEMGKNIQDIQLSIAEQPGPGPIAWQAQDDHSPVPVVASQPGSAREPAGQALPEQPPDALPDPVVMDGDLSTYQPGKYADRENAQRFFEENASRVGVVTLPSGLQYRVISPGHGRSPGVSDKVLVDYQAYLLDGTEFDSSFTAADEPVFKLDDVIPGWKEALLRMEEGAQWELFIPADLTHKGSTRKRGMLGYQPLVYIMQLKSVISADTADPGDPL